MEQKLSELNLQAIYQAYENANPAGEEWVGRWGIFKNNQLQYIIGNWTYGRKNEATLRRNEFIGKVYLARPPGEHYTSGLLPVGFTIPWAPGSTTQFPEPATGAEHSYELDIRRDEPDLFERLKNLYQVREITAADLPNIIQRLGGG